MSRLWTTAAYSLLTSLALLALLPGAARAQTAPPPAEIPSLPDVPLPEWKLPPPASAATTIMLGVSRELRAPEQMRLAGLLTASLGLGSVLAGGVMEAWAVDLDTGLKSPRDGRFHPEVARQRDQVAAASLTLLIVGGAAAVTGFTLYAIGQVRINHWHQRHPRDPLPPLSGF
jgi:hypothetical protein